MTPDPYQRLLGVDANADALTLLGLDHAPRNRVEIETALRQRIGQIFQHPDGRSAEAEMVRRRLRRIASMLIARGPRADLTAQRRVAPRRHAGHRLTDFDCTVLAILVGSGGWNARSRALLVAHAGMHQITPAGLMKVMRGLGDYARERGEPIPAAALALPAPRLSVPPVDPEVLSRVVGEAESTPEWPTVKLSVLFGMATMLIAALVLPPLLRSAPAPAAPPLPPRVVRSVDPAPPAVKPISEAPVPRVARFRRTPTFLGNALPPVATDAADASPGLPDELELIASKISIADEPSEAVYRTWATAVDTIASGWVLVDGSTRQRIERGMVRVLAEAGDTPSVSDRLLDALVPPRGRLADPLDVWRGSYLAARLAAIASDAALAPAVVERARSQLSVALGESGAGVNHDARSAADAWLRQALDGLVDDLETSPRIYDAWESWLAAQRKLGDPSRMNDALLEAVTRVLATDTDLHREGPSLNVLGRLLTVADFGGLPVVKERVDALFRDRTNIDTHDLWVLTSLLAQLDTAPWFRAGLVLPHDADDAFRNRLRDRIAQSWPVPVTSAATVAAQGRGVSIDGETLARWSGLIPATPARRAADETLMEQLVIVSRLNEAAALFAQRRLDEGQSLLDTIVRDDSGGDRGLRLRLTGRDSRPRIVPQDAGQKSTMDPDGAWAEGFDEARRNTQQKVERLRELRTRAGTDLGPIDAEAFVGIVYRGTPQEVRTLARDIAIDQFARGRNVSLELLDQFPTAPRQKGTSELLQGFTGQLLPPVRNPTWPQSARLALLEYTLVVREREASLVDALTVDLAVSFAQRGKLAQGNSSTRAPGRPSHEATRLAEAWVDRAATAITTNPVPDDLEGLRRRRAIRHRLATGPIQLVVAELVTTLDHLAYVTVAEQPRLEAQVVAVLDESKRRRIEASNVLVQAIEVEMATNRIWQMRFVAEEAAP